MSYVPQAGSVAARAVEHFKQHPGTRLKAAELGKLLDVNASNLAALLATPITHGLIARAGGDRGPEYIGGRKLFGTATSASTVIPPAPGPLALAAPASAPPPAPAPAAAAAPTPKAATAPALRAPLPSIVIEADVPLPHIGRTGLFDSVFERMQPGNSFVVPTISAKRMINLARVWGKPRGAEFASRMVADDKQNTRIWRTK
jgi:hypothetical protein